MNGAEATAEVFWTAFKACPRKEREAFIARLVRDRRLWEDLVDRVLIRAARAERGKDLSIEEYLRTRRKSR